MYKYPIFTVEGEVFGYDILVRDGSRPDPGKESSMILNLLIEEDPQEIFKNRKVFLRLSQEFIEADLFELLPSSFVVIKVGSGVKITEEFIKDIKELKMRGFPLCIEGFSFEKVHLLPLLPVSDFVVVRWNPRGGDDFKEEIRTLRVLGKKIIITGVDEKEDVEKARELADFLQGKALGSPSLVKDIKSVLFLKNTIIKMYYALMEKNIKKIIKIIESDVGLTYKLLKWVKNFYPGKAEGIQDVEDALVFMSINDITNFVLALTMAELFADKREEEIIKRSLFRAHLAQELGRLYIPGSEKQAYFIGLFSLMEELIGEEPASLARELKLSEEIIEAFERRYNEYGFLLSLVELLELHRDDEEIINHVARMINAKPEDVKKAIQKAQREASEFTQ